MIEVEIWRGNANGSRKIYKRERSVGLTEIRCSRGGRIVKESAEAIFVEILDDDFKIDHLTQIINSLEDHMPCIIMSTTEALAKCIARVSPYRSRWVPYEAGLTFQFVVIYFLAPRRIQ